MVIILPVLYKLRIEAPAVGLGGPISGVVGAPSKKKRVFMR